MAGTPFTAAELDALRGALATSSNTARDLAATAQTRCTRRRALAVVGAKTEAAADLLGPVPPSEQSPFAFEIGRRFERALRRDDAARLREAIGSAVDVDPESLGVIDIDAEHPWKGKNRAANAAAADARLSRTDALFVGAATGQIQAPVLVLHPRMTLTVTDTSRHVEPDGLLLRPGEEPLLVEIKAYVDHGHRTDTHDLATTRLQLAVYHLAVVQAQSRLGIAVQHDRVLGVVVLRKPNSMFGSAGVEDITRDVSRVERALGRTPATLASVLSDLPEGATASFDDPEVLRCLPTRYEPGYCLSGCAMSLQCRAETSAQSRPEYLGSPVAEVLAPVGDIRKAHDIATGALEPASDEERAFAERVRPLRRRIDAARSRCS